MTNDQTKQNQKSAERYEIGPAPEPELLGRTVRCRDCQRLRRHIERLRDQLGGLELRLAGFKQREKRALKAALLCEQPKDTPTSNQVSAEAA